MINQWNIFAPACYTNYVVFVIDIQVVVNISKANANQEDVWVDKSAEDVRRGILESFGITANLIGEIESLGKNVIFLQNKKWKMWLRKFSNTSPGKK